MRCWLLALIAMNLCDCTDVNMNPNPARRGGVEGDNGKRSNSDIDGHHMHNIRDQCGIRRARPLPW